MVRICACSPVRFVSAAVLALLLLGVIAPRRVEAGCAALDHAFDTEQFRRTFSPWTLGLAVPAREVRNHPFDSDRPEPCSGLSCSRNTDPPRTPVVREVWYLEHGALVPLVPVPPPPDSRAWRQKATDGKPSPRPSGTFRPPRPAQAYEHD